jgi:outer membrane protein OmpA-like peptidoglycan-associated protein
MKYLIKYTFLLCLPAILKTTLLCAQSIPIGQPINTPSSDEYNPCISGNGRTLIFEQLYFNESKPRVMITYQRGGGWVRPEPLPGANTEIPTILNGGFFLNPNGNIILFHSARYGGVGNSDIWMIEKNILGNWSAPKNMAKPINSTFAETDPSLSPDGKFLYFTRLNDKKTPDGNPCGKIMVSEKYGNSWKNPVELPAPINQGCECSGRMLSDNKTFLFSSMRSDGIGGYDVYKTELTADGTWATPVPYTFINTDKDDRYVSVPAGGGLVYHSAPSKTGGLDVMRTQIPAELQPDKVTLLQGNVKNASNNLVLVPRVVVTNTSTQKSFSYPGAADGSYTAFVPQDDSYDVAIQANDAGFTFQSMLFHKSKQPKYEEKTINTNLHPYKVGTTVALANIKFVQNTDTLQDYSTAEINRLYLLLKTNITLKIELAVHTDRNDRDTTYRPGYEARIVDTIGTYTDSAGRVQYKLKTTYTNDNTLNQAKAIAAQLVKRGIPSERVLPKGYGNKVPLTPVPADKALLRRVEFKVIQP